MHLALATTCGCLLRAKTAPIHSFAPVSSRCSPRAACASHPQARLYHPQPVRCFQHVQRRRRCRRTTVCCPTLMIPACWRICVFASPAGRSTRGLAGAWRRDPSSCSLVRSPRLTLETLLHSLLLVVNPLRVLPLYGPAQHEAQLPGRAAADGQAAPYSTAYCWVAGSWTGTFATACVLPPFANGP